MALISSGYDSWGKRGAVRTVEIDNGDIASADNQSLAHDQTETTGTASDHTNAILQAERGEGTLEVITTAALDGLRWRVVLLLWMLNLDCLVGTGELALVRVGTGLSLGAQVDVPVILLIEASRKGAEGTLGGAGDGGRGWRADGGGGGSRELADQAGLDHGADR